MVGAKRITPQLSNSLLLGWCVLQQNLYRRLKHAIDLTFLYQAVTPYYSKCGQLSINHVVFRAGGPVQVNVGGLFGKPDLWSGHYPLLPTSIGHPVFLRLRVRPSLPLA